MSHLPTPVPLDSIASCFEGQVPSAICTLSSDGVPNVTYLSVVQLVDARHIALSRQFFNKTDRNTVVDPRAQIIVVEPETGRPFRLDVVYERTETSGPLFDRMKTNLDAVASQEGMSDVFVLVGTDICRVEACEMVPCDFPEPPSERRDPGLDLVHSFAERIAGADCLDVLLRDALQACSDLFGYDHGFIMLVDDGGSRLRTVASLGLGEPGPGADVALGEGILGIAADRKQCVRIANMAHEIGYSQAIRQGLQQALGEAPPERELPLPGLPHCLSLLAVPMLAFGQRVGMLCIQSEVPGRFGTADEHLASIVANHLGIAIALLRATAAAGAPIPASPPAAVRVRHYSQDDSVFFDDDYVIKGVAGRILWRLLQCYQAEQRVEFSNKEIRLDPELDLPDIKDNLEARLILLARRLDERADWLRIVRPARGRLRLEVSRQVELQEVAPRP